MFTAISPNQIPLPLTLQSSTPRKFPLNTITMTLKSQTLDHLQRAPKQNPALQQPPPTPSRRRASPLVLWDGFPASRTVRQLMDTMDRVLDDPILAQSEAGDAYRRKGRAAWEIREGEGEYRLRFDMPGMTRGDVKVWVEDGMLVFTAEKRAAEKEGEKEDWPAAGFGKYGSRIALPDNAVAEEIKAEVRDGVLYVVVPKATPVSKVLDIDVK